MSDAFLGYVRSDGGVGTRNQVLILSLDRFCNRIADEVHDALHGTRVFRNPGDLLRPRPDRELVGRVLVGLGCNANVAGVVLVGMAPHANSAEADGAMVAETIARTGKPVELVTVEQHGGQHGALAAALAVARRMVVDASRQRRQPAPLGALTLAVKCGASDAFSGIAGNPTVGRLFDAVVAAGGTAIFDETTEVIGAEHVLARRFLDPAERERFLALVAEHERRAIATGEDIRTINPIPANIKGGISTLEEKSLGAIAKAGSAPLQGVLLFGERPRGRGLYFMDGWPAGNSVYVGFAAAGATVVLYQLGGEGLPPGEAPAPATNSGIVAPMIMLTGNPRVWAGHRNDVDFGVGIISGEETPEEAGRRLLRYVLDVASGELTKGEVWRYQEQIELPFRGPLL